MGPGPPDGGLLTFNLTKATLKNSKTGNDRMAEGWDHSAQRINTIGYILRRPFVYPIISHYLPGRAE